MFIPGRSESTSPASRGKSVEKLEGNKTLRMARSELSHKNTYRHTPHTHCLIPPGALPLVLGPRLGGDLSEWSNKEYGWKSHHSSCHQFTHLLFQCSPAQKLIPDERGSAENLLLHTADTYSHSQIFLYTKYY